MKKVISIILCAVLMLAAVLPMTVGAAGVLLFNDTFDEDNSDNWIYEGTLFYTIDGHLEGDAQARVHQTNFLEELGGNKMWGTGVSLKVEAWSMEDMTGNGDGELKIWWADYFKPDHDESDDDYGGRIIYSFGYKYGENKWLLHGEFHGEVGATYSPVPDETDVILAEADAPAMKIDISEADHFTLGMKIDNGVIYCYANDELVITHNAERGADCGTGAKSPFLLINNGNYCAFDNAQVATADYGLFHEFDHPQTAASSTEAGQTEAPVVTEPQTTAIKEVVVTKIGDDGEVVTEIETVIVTNAPTPDTQKQPTNPQGGAQTGDMAVIVIAVMAVALGAAIVVKKVND